MDNILIFGGESEIAKSAQNFLTGECRVVSKDLRLGFDARDEKKVQSIIAEINPNIVLNCVGINDVTVIEETPSQDWMGVIEANLGSYYNIVRAMFLLKPDRDRVIISVGSNSAYTPRTFSSAYCVSKLAMFGLTQNAARESAKTGKRLYFVQIDCGFTHPTAMSEKVLTDRDITVEECIYRTPYGEHFAPEEIGKLIAFLAYNGKGFSGNSVRLDYAEL